MLQMLRLVASDPMALPCLLKVKVGAARIYRNSRAALTVVPAQAWDKAARKLPTDPSLSFCYGAPFLLMHASRVALSPINQSRNFKHGFAEFLHRHPAAGS